MSAETLITGESNTLTPAALKIGRIKASTEEIVPGLTGDYRPKLIFILQQELQLYEFYQTQILTIEFYK